MYTIDIKIAEALYEKRYIRICNTKVIITEGVAEVQLHDNTIARLFPDNSNPMFDILELTLAGYGTKTTRARLNGILHCFAVNNNWDFINIPEFYIRDSVERLRFTVGYEYKTIAVGVTEKLRFNALTGELLNNK